MKRLTVLPIIVLILIAVGSTAYMVYDKQTVRHEAKQVALSTDQTADTSPTPIATQPATPSPDAAPKANTTTATTTQTTATAIFQASSSEYAATPSTLPSFTTTNDTTASYSYTCDTGGAVSMAFHYSASGVIVLPIGGDALATTHGLPAAPGGGYFVIRYDASKNCTWQISVAN